MGGRLLLAGVVLYLSIFGSVSTILASCSVPECPTYMDDSEFKVGSKRESRTSVDELLNSSAKRVCLSALYGDILEKHNKREDISGMCQSDHRQDSHSQKVEQDVVGKAVIGINVPPHSAKAVLTKQVEDVSQSPQAAAQQSKGAVL